MVTPSRRLSMARSLASIGAKNFILFVTSSNSIKTHRYWTKGVSLWTNQLKTAGLLLRKSIKNRSINHSLF